MIQAAIADLEAEIATVEGCLEEEGTDLLVWIARRRRVLGLLRALA